MHPNTRNLLGASAICLSALVAIGGAQGQQANATSWILNGTSGCSLQEQVEVGKDRIVDINPARRDVAIRILKDESAVLLSNQEFKELVYGRRAAATFAHEMTGMPNDPSSLKPYLVRAVSASTSNRSISVRRCHQDLLVFSGSLGGDGPQKDPVVVFLRSKPRKVFVSYMTAK